MQAWPEATLKPFWEFGGKGLVFWTGSSRTYMYVAGETWFFRAVACLIYHSKVFSYLENTSANADSGDILLRTGCDFEKLSKDIGRNP